MHTVSLIFVHSFHYTVIWSRKSLSSLQYADVQVCTNVQNLSPSPRVADTTHTHKPDQRPCPGNLFQPICAAVRVGLIVSCVCNVSETVIGKSFETLKSFRLPLSLAFTLPPLLSPSLTVKLNSTIAPSLALIISILPLSHMLALYFYLCASLPPCFHPVSLF